MTMKIVFIFCAYLPHHKIFFEYSNDQKFLCMLKAPKQGSSFSCNQFHLMFCNKQAFFNHSKFAVIQ